MNTSLDLYTTYLMTNKTKHMYAKEVKRAVKKDGKTIGWNIVRISYDKNNNKVGERIITYISK